MTLSDIQCKKLTALDDSLAQNYTFKITDEVAAVYNKIKSDASKSILHFQVAACFIKLQHDPHYPGLKSHRYKDLDAKYNEKIWESYVQNKTPTAWRLFWCYSGDKEITLVILSPHPK